MRAPRASAMWIGWPPTPRKARTGEFTPPGMTRAARSAWAAEVVVSSGCGCLSVTAPASHIGGRARTGPAPAMPATRSRSGRAGPEPDASTGAHQRRVEFDDVGDPAGEARRHLGAPGPAVQQPPQGGGHPVHGLLHRGPLDDHEGHVDEFDEGLQAAVAL